MTTKILIGERFGRLTVSSRDGNKWLCQCDCGGSNRVVTAKLLNGNVRSCGCLRKEIAGASLRTHGASNSLTYLRWRSMRARCLLPTSKSYPKYGGRGITICERWRDSFVNFLADMGECPGPEMTMERINNEKGYSPENCRWATRKEQNRNTSRSRMFRINGEQKTLSEWCEIFGVGYYTAHKRLRLGKSIEVALGISK